MCNWTELSREQRIDLLRRTPAGDVWGIGRRIAARLAEQGILTALDVARMPASLARDEWSVLLERTVRELQGISCISLEQAPAPKQQIACTRIREAQALLGHTTEGMTAHYIRHKIGKKVKPLR